MAMASESAHQYLIDPLTAPVPSEETGPGTHFRSTFAPQPKERYPSPPSSAAPSQTSTNPFRRSSASNKAGPNVTARPASGESNGRVYPSPPNATSPRAARFPSSHRSEAFPAYTDNPTSPRNSGPRARGSSMSNPTSPKHATTRSRGNSLGERFPGDQSHQPLQMLRKDSKRAHRSPHLKKKHIPPPDSIDRLDTVPGGKYHHEGPYDAALWARNRNFETSPLAAVADSNEEALKATPKENVLDAVRRHRPLDGTAAIPPGEQDRFGRTYDYREKNIMIEGGGDYKRWPGVEYEQGDEKGKGEPAYSLERALQEHRIEDGGSANTTGIEMADRSGKHSMDTRDPVEIAGGQQSYSELEQNVRRSGSKKLDGGLKKRMGSLRKKRD